MSNAQPSAPSYVSLVPALMAAFSCSAGPLSPAEERASFVFADPRLTAECVASEPDVTSPVALSWDADGRLFVAEMTDYPAGKGQGRIRMLQDSDGDGRYEVSRVFADQIPFPNGVLAWNGGVLVTAAPDILFLKDHDNDGKSDERRVVLTGFGEGNQQLRVNGLIWGIDGWIYGANGRSDGEVGQPGQTNRVSIRGHDFRFRPDSWEVERTAGRSQFGLTRDDWGNRFLSWNTIPVRHDAIPEAFLRANPRIAVGSGLAALVAENDDHVFPISAAPQTFNQESTSHYNALGGLHLYRGDFLPPTFRGNIFVGETLRNLVHRRTLHPRGATFEARRTEKEAEFLASGDPWFHPVNFATGPDGALYVADFYRLWVEHPDFVPQARRGEQNWQEGASHGRIWRIRTGDTPSRPVPVLPGRMTTSECVAGLESPNGWVRDTAHRLLCERRDYSAHAPLKALALRSNHPEARVLSLHLLGILKGLDETNITAALADNHPRVREAAIQVSIDRLGGSEFLARRVLALTRDRDDRVRLWVALAAAGAAASNRVDVLAQIGGRTTEDGLLGHAIRASAADRPWPVLEQVLWMESTSLEASEERLRFLEGMALDVGATGDEFDRGSLITTLMNMNPRGGPQRRLALMSGFLAGGESGASDFRRWVDAAWSSKDKSSWRDRLAVDAHATAGNAGSGPVVRGQAVQVLAHLRTAQANHSLEALLSPGMPGEVQKAAARAVGDRASAEAWRRLYGRWGELGLPARRTLVESSLRLAETAAVLLEALEQARVAVPELSPRVTAGLREHPDAELRQRAARWVGNQAAADREKVIRDYSQALVVEGDPAAGREHFLARCASCHRLGNEGASLGPDLKAIGSRGPEILLADIVDPSRQVASDHLSYEVSLTSGETLTGWVTADQPEGVGLRRPALADLFIPRAEIRSVRASSRSLMPDGLEQGLSAQAMADLLAFIRKPGP